MKNIVNHFQLDSKSTKVKGAALKLYVLTTVVCE